MPHKLEYDWAEIQKYYDEGHSLRQCQARFGFGTTARSKAIKAGRLVVRTFEEAVALKRKHAIAEPTGNNVSPTTWKGEIACAKFDLFCVVRGIVVSRPQVECAYDRIVDLGKLHRVQVKYAGESNSDVIVGRSSKTCRTRGRKVAYADNEIDAIVLYHPGMDRFYWLPKKIWAGKKTVQLRLKPPGNGQIKNWHDATDYEWGYGEMGSR